MQYNASGALVSFVVVMRRSHHHHHNNHPFINTLLDRILRALSSLYRYIAPRHNNTPENGSKLGMTVTIIMMRYHVNPDKAGISFLLSHS